MRVQTKCKNPPETPFSILDNFCYMNFRVGPPVQNLTKIDENMRKRNEILTTVQTTQNDPGSSKITSELTSDENSTFHHFCPAHETNLEKMTKTKWNFDYGPNDSEWPREFKNHLGFDLRWKFNFFPFLPRPRKILKKWKLKPSGIQLTTRDSSHPEGNFDFT